MAAAFPGYYGRGRIGTVNHLRYCSCLIFYGHTAGIVVGSCHNHGVGSSFCKFDGNFTSFVECDKFRNHIHCIVGVSAAVNRTAFYHQEEASAVIGV